jgi:hypothetical protein
MSSQLKQVFVGSALEAVFAAAAARSPGSEASPSQLGIVTRRFEAELRDLLDERV